MRTVPLRMRVKCQVCSFSEVRSFKHLEPLPPNTQNPLINRSAVNA